MMKRFCVTCTSIVLVALIASSTQASLLDYWDFNETVGSSNTADDQGANNLDVDLTEDATYVTSTYNSTNQTVLSLDGSGDYAKTTAGQPFGGGTSHTITLWAKHNNATTGTLETYISWGIGGARYFFGVTNSVMRLGYGAGGTANVNLPTSGYDETQWHHYALAYNADTHTTTMYLDGSAIGSATGANAETVTGGELRIGHQYTGNTEYLDGMIDDLAVFDNVFTQDEIQIVMADGPLSVPEPSTVVLAGVALLGLVVLHRRKR